MTTGAVGETYVVGGNNEKTNLEVVQLICASLDKLIPEKSGNSYAEFIEFVADRPGHDKRYAIDASKINRDLGWSPKETFSSGLSKTIIWYVENQGWCEEVKLKL